MNSKCAKRLSEVKSEIKSVVMSNPSQMSPNDLVKEYLSLVGRRLSPGEFGYGNLLEFLKRECADILKIETARGTSVLCPIMKTENDILLNSLIAKQNLSKSKGHNHPIRRKAIVSDNVDSKNRGSFGKLALVDGRRTDSKPTSATPKKFAERPISTNDDERPKNRSQEKSEDAEECDEIERNFKILITKHKKLRASEFLAAYYINFKKKLDFRKAGFSSVVLMCERYSEIFTVKRVQSLNDWFIYDKNTYSEIDFIAYCKARENKNIVEETSNMSLDDQIFGLEALPHVDIDPSLKPKNCISFGHKINRVSAPTVNTELEIFVAEVVSPSHFWFHIKSEDHSMALKELMIVMDDFYKSNPDSYIMARALMRPNQYCAVKFSNIYHRAVILRNISYNVVKVRYIDYGTIRDVTCEDIRLLLNEFGELKEQALWGRLSGVLPAEHNWSQASRKRFLELVDSKPLSGYITKVESTGVSCLTLVDKCKGISRELSQVLFDEGYAKLNWCDINHFKYIERLYLLPSFEDLESGYFPMYQDYCENTDSVILIEKIFFSIREMLNEDVTINETDRDKSSDVIIYPRNIASIKNSTQMTTHQSNSPISFPLNSNESSNPFVQPNLIAPRPINSLQNFQIQTQPSFPNAVPHNFFNCQYNLHPQMNAYYPEIPIQTNTQPYTFSNFDPFFDSNTTPKYKTPLPFSYYTSAQRSSEYHSPTVSNMSYFPELNIHHQINKVSDKYSQGTQTTQSPDINVPLKFNKQNFDFESSSISTPNKTLCKFVENDLRSHFESLSVENEMYDDHYNSKDMKKIIVNSIEKATEQSETPQNHSNISQKDFRYLNLLILIDIIHVSGSIFEIWKIECENEYIDYHFVLLEQILQKFISPNELKIVLNEVFSTTFQFDVVFVECHDNVLFLNLKNHQQSMMNVGDNVSFDSLSNMSCKAKSNILLMRVDHILNFLRHFRSSLQIHYRDVCNEMLPILKKHSK